MTMILPRRPVTVPLTKTPANTTLAGQEVRRARTSWDPLLRGTPAPDPVENRAGAGEGLRRLSLKDAVAKLIVGELPSDS